MRYVLLLEIRCPPVPVWDGMTGNTSKRTYGTVVEYHCEEGYYFNKGGNGSKSMKCGADGKWHPQMINCTGEIFILFYIKKQKS